MTYQADEQNGGRSARAEDAVGRAGPAPADTLRVSVLASMIQGALKQAFPRRLWVVGEAAELERNRHRKHWFFRLCESDPDGGRSYSLGAVLWAADAQRLFGRGGALEGVIEPRDGIEIRALCEVDFYPPHGDLRLIVRDIDAAYTLGRIALERQRLIERLGREGILERQKKLALAAVPLRLGLITSEKSAAYSDFVKELLASGLAFRLRCFDARMQGEETVRTVLRGLEVLARDGAEAIALVRGGGSAVDLAWFDREEIARAIAGCPVPVLCGIGHEIDTSVSDLAAHASFKTPTAVAAFLVERGQEALRLLADAAERLADAAQAPRLEAEALAAAAEELLRATAAAVRAGEAGMQERARALRRLAPHALAEALGAASALGARLPRGAARALEQPERGLLVLRARARALPVRLRLEQGEDLLLRLARGLRRAAGEGERRAAGVLAALEARARVLDPRNVVRRGFAILRNARGAVVKEAAAVAGGDRIIAEVRDGRIAARVERTRTNPAEELHDGTKEGQEPGGGSVRGPRQLEIW